MPDKQFIFIVLADDNEDDYLFTARALEKSGIRHNLAWVKDGEELLQSIRSGFHADETISNVKPSLILLDLNMPNKDGRATLKELKSDPELKSIPTVILTTSKSEEDINKCYTLGANSYLIKPVDFESFVQQIQDLCRYWFQVSALPS